MSEKLTSGIVSLVYEDEPRLETEYPADMPQPEQEIRVSPKSYIDPLLEELTQDYTDF